VLIPASALEAFLPYSIFADSDGDQQTTQNSDSVTIYQGFYGQPAPVPVFTSTVLETAEGGPAEVITWTLPPISFDVDIRPILAENCFACHGPDDKRRMVIGMVMRPNPGRTVARPQVQSLHRLSRHSSMWGGKLAESLFPLGSPCAEQGATLAQAPSPKSLAALHGAGTYKAKT
jgi:hypothetical protein